MADPERQEKLAAARKKLRKFQEKSTKTIDSSTIPASVVSKATKHIEELPLQHDSLSLINSQVGTAAVKPAALETNEDLPPVKNLEDKWVSVSSTESIRQISLQLNGLMSETHEFLNGEIEVEAESSSVSELEIRNLELAAVVEKQNLSTDHLTSQLEELRSENTRLQQQLRKQKEEIEERNFKEQGSLKEQLQVHIQTIGILVAEKTELQSSLSQSQQTAKQKAAEVEELQGRLKANRQRANDIERDLNNATNSVQQFEKSSKEFSREVDRLKLEIYKHNKKMEEMQQQNSELTEKLNSKIVESQSLQEQLEETKSRLSMAELRVQQLSGSEDNRHLLESLSEDKIQLEKKVTQLKDSVLKLSQERDSMTDQYKQFTQLLNQQVQNLGQQISSLSEEKAALANDKIVLSNRVNSLEVQLEQTSKQSGAIPLANDEIDRLHSMMALIEEEKARLQEQHEKDVSDNAQLSRLAEELEQRVQQLESSLESKKEEAVDRQHLLNEIESDKVATSRAMAQNRELKKQLEELQNGFIVMSNNKLELVEKLESEQHVAKELGERLSQQEEELNGMKDQLVSKDRDLNLAHQSSTEISKQLYQQQQILDRVHHYEAQGQLSELLQRELTQSQERVSVLTTQNSELRTMLAQQGKQMLETDGDNNRESSQKDDMVASLSASVRQLEMERNTLLRQLGEQQGQREVFRAQLKEMRETKLLYQNGDNGESVSSDEYGNMKHAMHQLEDRFTKTMSEIAELSDQKQQLEHLVTQLQGETDTIGEYIALYQVQRGIMKQRAHEKDEYIAQLARDREDLKSKLTTLQDLVMRLLYERQQYQRSNGETVQPPGKAVPSFSNNIDMSALNGVANFPEWPDLVDDFEQTGAPLDARPEELLDCNSIPTASHKSQVSTKDQDDTTAKKIMDLITEIGTSSLVEKPIVDSFHPCPLCSGKLMTV